MSTRSGLMASPQKRIPRHKKVIDINSLLPCAFTRPAQFSIKPFASLYNPYSKGCSSLCNHPVKKKGWTCSNNTAKPTPTYAQNHQIVDIPDHVPEEFFRRYTDQLDNDSRPLTPTPSCATSARTRGGHRDALGGSHLSGRRCVTPEPQISNEQERKQIILDLRRSHSQETVYYNASSEFSQRQDSISSSWLPQPVVIKHEIAITGIPQKDDIDDIQEEEELENLFSEDIINEIEDLNDPSMSCINNRGDDEDDEETLRRRGKLRRKKSKTNVQVITFTPSNEPLTQVCQIDDLDQDSPYVSSRHSLVADSSAATALAKFARNTDDFAAKAVFHTDDSLKTLRMGLNVEIVECVFDRYRFRTLQEALRTISLDKLGVDSYAVANMKDSLNLKEIDYEKWQHLPRRFSRSSSRFELPIDIREMAKLRPFSYLSKFVYVDDDKKQLYHRTFVKFLPKNTSNREENENDFFANPAAQKNFTENLLSARTMPLEVLTEALHEVLGFHATDANVLEIQSYLELESLEEAIINFRTFCGIVAFAERLITSLSQEEDPRDEIEIADFETLLARHCHRIESTAMQKMLKVIER